MGGGLGGGLWGEMVGMGSMGDLGNAALLDRGEAMGMGWGIWGRSWGPNLGPFGHI